MEQSVVVDRRTLITQAWASQRLLHLHVPVLLDAGQGYWVDLDTDSLIVEGVDGRQESFPGHYGDPAKRSR